MFKISEKQFFTETGKNVGYTLLLVHGLRKHCMANELLPVDALEMACHMITCLKSNRKTDKQWAKFAYNKFIGLNTDEEIEKFINEYIANK